MDSNNHNGQPHHHHHFAWSHPSVLNFVRVPSSRVMESLNFLFHSNTGCLLRPTYFSTYR